MDLHLDVQEGLIKQVKIFSDALFPNYIEDLQEILVGKPYGIPGLQQIQTQIQQRMGKQFEDYNKDFIQWLRSAM